MRCNKCGCKIRHETAFCTRCGSKIDVNGQNEENGAEHQTLSFTFKAYKKYITIGLVGICFIGYFFGIRCKSGLCMLPSSSKEEYCVVHTCKIDGCINKKATDKNYCYTHSPTKSSGITYTPESAEDVLEFSNIKLSHNSSYTLCTGTITNNGRKTYSFVEIKGKFKNSSGTVLDTDWTYAVGSEGLAPGESTTFRISVDKNLKITKCTLEVFDYEKK